jgi:hypothetical protein
MFSHGLDALLTTTLIVSVQKSNGAPRVVTKRGPTPSSYPRGREARRRRLRVTCPDRRIVVPVA